MKIVRIPEFDCWAVAEWDTVPNEDGSNQLPTITPFNTREEARQYIQGNKPSGLSKIKLFYERLK